MSDGMVGGMSIGWRFGAKIYWIRYQVSIWDARFAPRDVAYEMVTVHVEKVLSWERNRSRSSKRRNF